MAQIDSPLPDSAELPSRARGRWTLLLIFALFFAPIMAALFLNSRLSDWRPTATKNYGQLVVPVVPMGDGLPTPDGDTLPPWRLIWPVVGTCEQTCEEQMQTLNRVKETLGRHQDKLELLVLADGAQPGLADSTLSARIRQALAARKLNASGLYLVDPLNNVMMYFPEDFDPTGLRKDLDRLIRHSKFQQ